MKTLQLNIDVAGDRPLERSERVARVLATLRLLGATPLQHYRSILCRTDPDGYVEDETLLVEMIHEDWMGNCHALGHILAAAAEQPSIAILFEDGTGRWVGPLASRRGAFDPDEFLTFDYINGAD